MRTLLIAEIGHNWVPNFQTALELIEYVKETGWDVAKFQAYDTDKIKQPGDTNYEELKRAELSLEQLAELRDKCVDVGVEFMASAFDLERIAWMETLGVKRHKLASRSIHDDAVVGAMVAIGKPIIASLGNWTAPWFPDFEADFLYCKSRRQILQNGFDHNAFYDAMSTHAGFSDHTIGNYYAKEAISRKVKIIEKHVTDNKNAPGWDQPSSADLWDMEEIANWREKNQCST